MAIQFHSMKYFNPSKRFGKENAYSLLRNRLRSPWLSSPRTNRISALKLLKEANIKYYTYDLLNQVPVKIVLQELHDYVDSGDDEIPELSKTLAEHEILP